MIEKGKSISWMLKGTWNESTQEQKESVRKC